MAKLPKSNAGRWMIALIITIGLATFVIATVWVTVSQPEYVAVSLSVLAFFGVISVVKDILDTKHKQ